MSAIVCRIVVEDDDDDRGSDDEADENEMFEEWVQVDRGSDWSSETWSVMVVGCATALWVLSSLGSSVARAKPTAVFLVDGVTTFRLPLG